MGTPHKHAELIKAWADGATIQFFSLNHGWMDCSNNFPQWSDVTKYRVKPVPETKTAYLLRTPEGRFWIADVPPVADAIRAGWKEVDSYTFVIKE